MRVRFCSLFKYITYRNRKYTARRVCEFLLGAIIGEDELIWSVCVVIAVNAPLTLFCAHTIPFNLTSSGLVGRNIGVD